MGEWDGEVETGGSGKVQKCKSGKVERRRVGGGGTGGRVVWAEANKSGAGVILFFGGVGFFLQMPLSDGAKSYPNGFGTINKPRPHSVEHGFTQWV